MFLLHNISGLFVYASNFQHPETQFTMFNAITKIVTKIREEKVQPGSKLKVFEG